MSLDRWHKEMCAICNKLSPWYDIDKIKSYAVYVWLKPTETNPFGVNIFDILRDKIVFYDIHIIPEEAMSIIREIQKKLKDGWMEVK